jgi:nuclear transport factor 2 (NTF2) superfamily protein
MTEKVFDEWVRVYGDSWEKKNPAMLKTLFSEDAVYSETPFDPPFGGLEAIENYWVKSTNAQDDIDFTYKILAVTQNRGIARWLAEFKRTGDGKKVYLDGILQAEFDDTDHCKVFREWWHRKEE